MLIVANLPRALPSPSRCADVMLPIGFHTDHKLTEWIDSILATLTSMLSSYNPLSC